MRLLLFFLIGHSSEAVWIEHSSEAVSVVQAQPRTACAMRSEFSFDLCRASMHQSWQVYNDDDDDDMCGIHASIVAAVSAVVAVVCLLTH